MENLEKDYTQKNNKEKDMKLTKEEYEALMACLELGVEKFGQSFKSADRVIYSNVVKLIMRSRKHYDELR